MVMGIVRRDSFRLSIIAYSGAIIGFLNKVFLFTNFLDTDQVGLANLLITLSLIYAQMAALGSRNIITRFFPFFRDDKGNHHGFLFAVLAFGMGGFLLASLLFLLLRPGFVFLYQDSSPLLVEYGLYLIPLALATLYFNLFESYLRSLFRNVVPTLYHEIALRLLVTLSIMLYALGLLSFPDFVLVYVASYFVPTAGLVLHSARKGLLLVRPQYSSMLRRLGRIMLVYGLYSLLNNLSTFLLVSIDSLMVAGMIDLGAAGIYTTMVFMTSVMLIPYRSLVKVAAPMLAGFWKQRALQQMQDLYQKAAAANMLIGSAIFLLLWVNLDTIFHFMAPEYAAGRYVFLMLGLGKLFDMSAGLNATILNTSRKYRYDLYFTLAMVAFAFLSNWLLIPLWGINGAALASMLSLVAFNLLRIGFIKHHFGIQPFIMRQLWVPLIMATIMLLSALFSRSDYLLADLVIRSTLCLSLFALPIWYLNLLPEAKEWVKTWIRRS